MFGRIESVDGRTVHEDAGQLRLVGCCRDIGDGVRVLCERGAVWGEHVDRVCVGHSLVGYRDCCGLAVLWRVGESAAFRDDVRILVGCDVFAGFVGVPVRCECGVLLVGRVDCGSLFGWVGGLEFGYCGFHGAGDGQAVDAAGSGCGVGDGPFLAGGLRVLRDVAALDGDSVGGFG